MRLPPKAPLALLLFLVSVAPALSADATFEDLTRGAVAREGFLDTYEKGDHLYLAIPPARLGRDMALVPRLDQGIGAVGLFSGLLFDRPSASLVAFERHGDRLFLVKRPARFTADAGSPEASALALSLGDSVLQSAPVLTTRPDGALVVDVYDWFVTDLTNIAFWIRQGLHPGSDNLGPASLDRARSWLAEVKVFPKNLEIRARLTFVPATPSELTALPDGRSVPLALHYSFADLPEPMEPRRADDRVGSLLTVRKDFSRTEDTLFVRYADRWRLEPGEKVGDLWRPKQPIVFFVDRTVPEPWRPWVKQGIEAWNRAFEAAGFKDAIRAGDLPEDTDPSDLRIHTVRWITSDQPDFAGAGQLIADPRTGEILDADVLLESSIVLQYHEAWKALLSPAARPAFPGPPADEVIGRGVRWVTMHEVGHSLGLDHNFRGSAGTPLERLYDRAWTREHGISASVMDYTPMNIPPLDQEVGDLFDAAVGPYDRWAISYIYTPDAVEARRLARLGAQPDHDYGMEEHLDVPGAHDPTLARQDMTADPIAWARERAALYRAQARRLPEIALSDDDSYDKLTTAFQAFLSGTASLAAPAVRTVGGQIEHRDHVGDPGERPPFAPVPRKRQEEALAFVIDLAFGPEPFGMDAETLRALGARPWAHWGVEPTHGGRVDYPFAQEVERQQRALLDALTDPYRLAAIQDAELKYGPGDVLPLPDLFRRLTEAVWKEEWTAPGAPVSALRRGLQGAWLDRMTTLVVKPPDRMPADARALARMELKELRDRLAKRLAPPARFDAYTRAHLMDVKDRIEKALAAKYPAEAR
jgi:hypothetical protein